MRDSAIIRIYFPYNAIAYRFRPAIAVNEFMFSAVARPTVGTKRTSLWGIQVREMVRP